MALKRETITVGDCVVEGDPRFVRTTNDLGDRIMQARGKHIEGLGFVLVCDGSQILSSLTLSDAPAASLFRGHRSALTGHAVNVYISYVQTYTLVLSEHSVNTNIVPVITALAKFSAAGEEGVPYLPGDVWNTIFMKMVQ